MTLLGAPGLTISNKKLLVTSASTSSDALVASFWEGMAG